MEKIKYTDIQKANELIKTTNIKGKDYAEVNERIKAFRYLYPQGTIATEMISNIDGVCIFKAMVYADNDPTINSLLGVGHAYEKEGSTYINKTSYIENCETSAVGRALGMAGIGIDTSVASADEVQNAITNQDKMKQDETLDKKRMIINDLCADKDNQDKYIAYAKKHNIHDPKKDLTIEMANELIVMMGGKK